MIKQADAKKMMAKNPNVDKKQLKEAIKLLNILRSMGVEDAHYNLAQPFSRRTAKLVDQVDENQQ